MAKQPALHHGLLLIDKPAGCTSHDVVDRVRRVLRQKRVGHCGTLDPAATGLLLLTTGRATRLSRFLTGAPKTYRGVIRFGIATDTYDATGEVTERAPLDSLGAEAVRSEMAAMTGCFEQAAPAYSAKKIAGRKSYELARRGEEVPVRRKEVEVHRFEPLGEIVAPIERVPFELACSTGTYARSMAHDLGVRIGCPAHLAELRRTVVGGIDVDCALELAALDDFDGPEALLDSAAWVPFDQIPLPFADVSIDLQQRRSGLNGAVAVIHGLHRFSTIDRGIDRRMHRTGAQCDGEEQDGGYSHQRFLGTAITWAV